LISKLDFARAVLAIASDHGTKLRIAVEHDEDRVEPRRAWREFWDTITDPELKMLAFQTYWDAYENTVVTNRV